MKTIIANWKMNGNAEFARRFVEEINEIKSNDTIVVCPPAALIFSFQNFRYNVGAQNCFYEENGAFTGENSPKLLKELGCTHVLLGHSERRTIFEEANEMIFRKCIAAAAHNLIPVVCIGEKSEERSDWQSSLSIQIKNYVGKSGDYPESIFAYEPLWSIGTGVTPTPMEIENVMDFLKNTLCKSIDHKLLYGGSVTSENASEILRCKNVDGVLVGGASLKIDEFKKIINSVS